MHARSRAVVLLPPQKHAAWRVVLLQDRQSHQEEQPFQPGFFSTTTLVTP